MLSKNKIKYLRSLSQKKYRYREGVFMAEGEKLVFDLIATSMELTEVYGDSKYVPELERKGISPAKINIASTDELSRVSLLKTAPPIVAVFRIPENKFDWESAEGGLLLALDNIQDPGNLGTIIRTADWFGIKKIICSTNTVDLFNPKTIQSTMGAIARVSIHYTDLEAVLEEAIQKSIPVYGTFLDGENIYQDPLSTSGIIVMGNEGQGISASIEERVSHRITIPAYPKDEDTSESLNVAVATSVICAEFRRRLI